MIPSIHLNGKTVEVDRLSSFPVSTSFERSTVDFLEQWLGGREVFEIHTSGSTGKPTKINIYREQMMASAKMTIGTLGLASGDTVHLCLNTGFIAGKMMLVRALMGKMNIIAEEPSSLPEALQNPENNIQFTALIPMQLENLLSNQRSVDILDKMKAIIIGGAPVSHHLEKRLQAITAPVYATFGMTETVTHIALKRMNGPRKSAYYCTFTGIHIGQDDRECLTITGPVTAGKTLVTNDRVKIIDGNHFKWLGRVDNVINSGGIKIQLEQVESKVSHILEGLGIISRSFAAGIPDPVLGQKLILCIEGKEYQAIDELIKQLKSKLPKYHAPGNILFTEHFIETETGKVNRRETLSILGY